jgi:hypothetical protein
MITIEKNSFEEELPFIVCKVLFYFKKKIKVIDSKNFEEILKSNKPVIKGTVEGVLDNNNESIYTGKLKVQFTEVTYHREKKEFCFEVDLFSPKDLKNPFYTKRSSNFKVYARKPNSNEQKKSKKQKTNDEKTTKEDLEVSFVNTFLKLKENEKKIEYEKLIQKLTMDCNLIF